MEDNLLNKLANIAIVRQHINGIINSNGIDRKNINPVQKMGRELDAQFIDLLLGSATVQESTINSERKTEVKDSKADGDKFATNFVKLGTDEEDKHANPSDIRPKFKTSKKAVKK